MPGQDSHLAPAGSWVAGQVTDCSLVHSKESGAIYPAYCLRPICRLWAPMADPQTKRFTDLNNTATTAGGAGHRT